MQTKSDSYDPLAEFRNRFICGDTLCVMRSMPDASLDLVVTSPPYNIRNSSGGGFMPGISGKWKNAGLADGYDSHNDAMPHTDYVEWQRACLTEMLRLIKDDGAIFYNHKWRVQNGLIQDRHDITDGFPVRQIIIWQRKGGMNFNDGYFLPTYEVIYLIVKKKFKLVKGANGYGDVWTITQDRGNPHPASFPVELTDRILASTPAKIVLDPFMGSGTTAVSAVKKGIDFIGIDHSQKYCGMAENRVADLRNA